METRGDRKLRLGGLLFILKRLLVLFFGLLGGPLGFLCLRFLMSFLLRLLRWNRETLHIIDVLVNVHLLGLLDIDEELLGVGSDLGAGPRADVLLDFLPVFAK